MSKIKFNIKDQKNTIYNMVIDLSKDKHINLKPQYIPDFLEIKQSNIPDSGLGVFTKILLKKHQFIGVYLGEKKKKL